MVSMYGVSFMILVIVLITMNEVEAANKEFKVGDNEGWRVPTEKNDYKEWAAKKEFHIGDSLRFEYKQDSVLVVDKWGYYHCNTSHPISTFKDGNTLFKLTKPGPNFFISGNENHCDIGQCLAVNVADAPKKSGVESVSVKVVSICLALVATSVALA